MDIIIHSGVLLFSFYAIFFIGKFINDKLNKSYNIVHELVKNDNPALALSLAGYYLGLVIAIGGAVAGPSNGLISDFLDITIYGLLAVVLLNLSTFICDKVILYKFKVSDELIRDQNQGTGAVSFGVCIASGFLIYGAVSGEGGSIWTAIGFWAIGQVILILAGKIYNFILPYDIHEEIEKDNVAAGVSFGGLLIGTGLIIGLSAEGDFYSWSYNIKQYVIYALIGLLLMPFVRFLTDKLLLPTESLSKEIAGQEKPNVGAAYIEGFSYIAAALAVNWCI
jgi:uncharacterized membrane protein YjfL (UPF0719 family)